MRKIFFITFLITVIATHLQAQYTAPALPTEKIESNQIDPSLYQNRYPEPLPSRSYYTERRETREYHKSTPEITYTAIRDNVESISKELSSSEYNIIDEMYIELYEDGSRWVYIKDIEMNGISNDEAATINPIANNILDLLFKSCNYNRSSPLTLYRFQSILKEYRIKGFKYETSENLHTLSFK